MRLISFTNAQGPSWGLQVGNGVVEISKALRERNDPNAPEVSERIGNVLWNAFLVGSFMAVSSNLRYQALARLNARLGQAIGNRTRLAAMGSTVLTGGLAYGNSAIGAMTYVWFADWSNVNIRGAAERQGLSEPAPAQP